MMVRTAPPLRPAPFPGIEHATLAGQAQGLRQLSVWHQRLASGATTPPHRHDCEEVVLCQGGRGEVELAGTRHPFAAASVLVIPAHAWHQIMNTGSDPLEMVAVFAETPVAAYLPDGTPLALPWES